MRIIKQRPSSNGQTKFTIEVYLKTDTSKDKLAKIFSICSKELVIVDQPLIDFVKQFKGFVSNEVFLKQYKKAFNVKEINVKSIFVLIKRQGIEWVSKNTNGNRQKKFIW
jgi:hypothetical protein